MAESLAVFCVLCFLTAFTMSMLLTIVSKRIAMRTGLIAYPKDNRFHKRVVPMGGGIAIFATIFILSLSAIIFIKVLIYDGTTSLFGRDFELYIEGFSDRTCELLIILGCGTLLFALGLWDDFKNLKPLRKLAVQFIVAFTAAYFADVRVEFFIESKLYAAILSSIWIVLIINVFNFLDNMDGASAGIAAIVSMIIFIVATLSQQAFVAGFSMMLAGTLTGFLIFNFYPASIFMGDAGSLVIGFFIGMLTLKTTYYQQSEDIRWYIVLMPFVILAIPLYDFVSVTALRLHQGKSPFVGDTQHFSHRLKRRGLNEVQTVLMLYLATITTGLGAVVLKESTWPYGLLVFLQTVMVLAIIAVLESTGNNEKKHTN
ncbi:MAG: MraY family glycosyltransferase [Phycisphaerales bacterium]